MNGRYVKSAMLSKSLEDAYKDFTMQHKFPFAVLHFQVEGDLIDVNVHPTKGASFSTSAGSLQYNVRSCSQKAS